MNPFYHEVRPGLTVDLRSVEFVEDRTNYYASLPDNPGCKRFTDAGTTFCVQTKAVMDRAGNVIDAQFNLTPEEGRKIQDALNWYSRQFSGEVRERTVIRESGHDYGGRSVFDLALSEAFSDGLRITPGTYQEIANPETGKGKAKVIQFVALER